jgi:hypothetical protein
MVKVGDYVVIKPYEEMIFDSPSGFNPHRERSEYSGVIARVVKVQGDPVLEGYYHLFLCKPTGLIDYWPDFLVRRVGYD